jgi:hypothetical protein
MFGIKRKIRNLGLKVSREILKRYGGISVEQVANEFSNGLAHQTEFIPFQSIKENCVKYADSQRVNPGEYKFAKSCELPCLYGTNYACQIYSLAGTLNTSKKSEKEAIANIIYNSQTEDGFFVDKRLDNSCYWNSDWWGKRHIVLLIIQSLVELETLPKYPFLWLKEYLNADFMLKWYKEANWNGDNDFDNQVMNIGCSLLYARDYIQMQGAKEAVCILQELILKSISSQTGLIQPIEDKNKKQDYILSRAVQYTYHLLTLLSYDNIAHPYPIQCFESVKNTQNKFGGFGILPNSSACEDIDSIELLMRISAQEPELKEEAKRIAKKAILWVMSNQNSDGGFVFKRLEKFHYGHELTSSQPNESNMFAAQFRLLSLAYLGNLLGIEHGIHIQRAPSYEF